MAKGGKAKGGKGGKGGGYNPYRDSSGKFAPGAKKLKERGENPAKAKSATHRSARALHFANKAADLRSKASKATDPGQKAKFELAATVALKKAQSHASIAKKLAKTDEEKNFAAQAQSSIDWAKGRGVKQGFNEETAHAQAKAHFAKNPIKTDTPVSGMAKPTGKTTAANSKDPAHRAGRAAFFANKVQEHTAKAQSAKTDSERQKHELAAQMAMKKLKQSVDATKKYGVGSPEGEKAIKQAEAALAHGQSHLSSMKGAPKTPTMIQNPKSGQIAPPKNPTPAVGVSSPPTPSLPKSAGSAHGTPVTFEIPKSERVYSVSEQSKYASSAVKSIGKSRSEWNSYMNTYNADGKHSSATPVSGFTYSEQRFRQTRLQFAKSLTADELDAAVFYSHAGDRVLNTKLRQGDWDGTPKINALQGHLDSAISKHVLQEDTYVGRGISGKWAENLAGALKPGDVFQEKGYTSTSATSPFSGMVQLRIKLPKGTRAAPIPTKYMNENEFLLPRGTKFRVISVKDTLTGGKHIEMEVVE